MNLKKDIAVAKQQRQQTVRFISSHYEDFNKDTLVFTQSALKIRHGAHLASSSKRTIQLVNL